MAAGSGGGMFAQATRRAAEARFKQRDVDAEGQEIDFDVREDEEQNVKLSESIDLLLAAGYFRARIKGLSPFDKIVGGMTWCIQTCNFDVDVDLLFQENSTIGQKIALTEKIVAVLPRMKCPHRLEPHQIQGLDFIHIYPVIQWLVKRAIETKEEMGDYIRSYSESQFNKYHTTPKDRQFNDMKPTATGSIGDVKSIYKPQRQYRRPASVKESDEETQVHSTLLEYGRRYGFGRSVPTQKSDDDKRKAVAGALGGGEAEGDKSERQREEEEKRIKALMKGMASAGTDDTLSSAMVGSIVGMQSSEILQVASEYEVKRADLESAQPSEKVLGAQSHLRLVTGLQKQIASFEKKCSEVQAKHDELYSEYTEAQEELAEVIKRKERIAREMEKLNEMENEENAEVLNQLRSLVSMNESLKKQETQFKAHCKEEKERLSGLIAQLKHGDDESEDSERVTSLKTLLQTDQEKLQKIRTLLARKNREIAQLQRKIDEIPSRAELTQYQRRFIELYSQVSSMLTETKQYFTLYNTLEDQKAYMEKEVGILTSIHEKFDLAMSSDKNKELFLQQVQQILDGIKQDKEQLGQRCVEERKEKDRLTTIHLDLIDKQRKYYKTVKDFQEECRKNETLLSKIKTKNR
uniref:Coiled-coil domain-containing protein 93 n=2 Tax=Amphimedon queenslandica TaxID=400682 RepID=A0A1X7TSN4_AMPQE